MASGSRSRSKRIVLGMGASVVARGRMHLDRIGLSAGSATAAADVVRLGSAPWSAGILPRAPGMGRYSGPVGEAVSVLGVAPELNDHVERVKEALVELRESVPSLHMASLTPDGQISFDIRDDQSKTGVKVALLGGDAVMVVYGISGGVDAGLAHLSNLLPSGDVPGGLGRLDIGTQPKESETEIPAWADDFGGIVQPLRRAGLGSVADRLQYLSELEADDPDQPKCDLDSLKSFVDFILSSSHLATEDVSVNREGLLSAHWFLTAPSSHGADSDLGPVADDFDPKYWGDGEGGITMVFTSDGNVRYAATSGPIVEGHERIRDHGVAPVKDILSVVDPFVRYVPNR